MINETVITDRLTEIDDNLKILEEIREVSKEDFCRQPKTYKLAERCLPLCIECVIDISHYLISQNQWTRPLDHTEALLILAQHNVIPKDFAQQIAGIVNFRNILVHAYLKINREIVYQNLSKIEDFRTFQKHILKYIEKAKK